MNAKRFPRRSLLGAAAAAPLAALAPAAAAEREPVRGIVGHQAPELEVPFWIGPDGEPGAFSLASVQGKWVFLKCFQAWCPGCHSSGFPALKQVADAFASEPRVAVASVQTVFEGFGTNTRDRVREMQLRYELPIPMGHDAGNPDGERLPLTMRNYRTGGTPWIIVIDRSGHVAYNDFHINATRFIEIITEQLG